jgi:hypothetical protein
MTTRYTGQRLFVGRAVGGFVNTYAAVIPSGGDGLREAPAPERREWSLGPSSGLAEDTTS